MPCKSRGTELDVGLLVLGFPFGLAALCANLPGPATRVAGGAIARSFFLACVVPATEQAIALIARLGRLEVQKSVNAAEACLSVAWQTRIAKID